MAVTRNEIAKFRSEMITKYSKDKPITIPYFKEAMKSRVVLDVKFFK